MTWSEDLLVNAVGPAPPFSRWFLPAAPLSCGLQVQTAEMRAGLGSTPQSMVAPILLPWRPSQAI